MVNLIVTNKIHCFSYP